MATILGTPGNKTREVILGTANDDTIYPLGGWDYVDGGGGFDTVIVAGSHTAFRLSTENGATYVDVLSAASEFGGRVELRNVEQVQYLDLVVSLVVDDVIQALPGSDDHDGGPGLDTLVYNGPRANYEINRGGIAHFVYDSVGTDGDDRLVNIERLSFTDIGVALDLDGAAGNTAKLIGALFGPGFVGDKGIVGIGLSLFDAGASVADVTALALGTELFRVLAGSSSNSDFVQLVYRNVFGQPLQDLAVHDSFVGLLETGFYTQVSLGMLAADSDANKARIDLVGLSSSGLEYIPYPG